MADVALELPRNQILDIDLDRQSFAGIAFPFSGTVLSTFAPKSDEDVIRTSIEMILLTRLGERVMFPEFGAFIPDLVFEPSDDVLAISLRALIQEEFLNWEDRATLAAVDVDPQESTIRIKMSILLVKEGEEREINIALDINRDTIINGLFPVKSAQTFAE